MCKWQIPPTKWFLAAVISPRYIGQTTCILLYQMKTCLFIHTKDAYKRPTWDIRWRWNPKYCECDFKRALGTNSSLELKRQVDKNRYNITFNLNKQYNKIRNRLLVDIIFLNKMGKIFLHSFWQRIMPQKTIHSRLISSVRI